MSHTTIKAIKARMILDSRGQPTTEVDLTTELGTFRAACPSGASTGVYEALELRDDDKTKFHGKGVEKALHNIRTVIAPAVLGMKVTDQTAIDAKLEELDGSANKTFNKLGANSALPVSMACAVAAAAELKLPLWKYINHLANEMDPAHPKVARLPVPCMNIINGGKHAGNKLAPQEYMIAPHKATSMSEAMRMGSEVYMTLKGLVKKEFGLSAIGLGDEGGFAPDINDPEAPLVFITRAIKEAGYEGKIGICMDAAAAEFYDAKTKKYNLNFKGDEPKLVDGKQLTDIYMGWCKKYPILSFEDCFDENDHEHFAHFLAQLKAAGLPTQVVGDDLTVSQVTKVREAIDKKACNSLLLKVNQVGTVTGALAAASLAMANGWSVMVSHRSGETEDVFIAHLVAGLGTCQIKSGAPARSERCCKYNELLRIEEHEDKLAYGYPKW